MSKISEAIKSPSDVYAPMQARKVRDREEWGKGGKPYRNIVKRDTSRKRERTARAASERDDFRARIKKRRRLLKEAEAARSVVVCACLVVARPRPAPLAHMPTSSTPQASASEVYARV